MNLYRIVGVAVVLVVWGVVAAAGWFSPILIPSPVTVARDGATLVSDLPIWQDLGRTAYRALFAFGVAALVGVPIGIAMGSITAIYLAFEFLVDFFRSIPPLALFPLFLLAFGIGEASKIAVPIYGATLVIIVASAYGVVTVSPLRRTVAKVFGLGRLQILTKVILPEALPHVVAGLRTALSLSLVLTVVVEMLIGSGSGIGKRIYDYQLVFETANMYVAILLTGTLGFGLNKIMVFIERRVLHWASS
jgi:NitT/TauT family transport system permease protein